MENLQLLQDQVNLHDYIETNYNGDIRKVGENTYRIDPCPVCGGNDHFTVYTDTNSYSSFTGCCEGGKILEYMMEAEHYTSNESIRRLYQMTSYENSNVISKENQEKEKDIRSQKVEYIIRRLENQTKDNKELAAKYLNSRGISSEMVDKYQLFISDDVYEDNSTGLAGTQRLVVPVFVDDKPYSYVARALEKVEDRFKAINSAGEQMPLNIDYIKRDINFPYENKNNVIYICEGWADALSVEDTGHKAIALHSVNNVKKFVKLLKDNIATAKKYTYVLCLDNDVPGRDATKKAIDEMSNLGIKAVTLKIPEMYNDMNEWYQVKPEDFKIGLDPFADENIANYLEKQFENDIIQNEMNSCIKTGFSNLDEKIGGLGSMLIAIGGGSSLGKTTLVHQICDQMAEKKQKVIYFSLEQSRFELVSKSISRETFKEGGIINAKSGLEIMTNSKCLITKKNAIENYRRYASNIQIVQGNFNTTVKDIRKYVESYIQMTGSHPVVVVDYLQILEPLNDKYSDKKNVDTIISELKRISRDNNIPVIAISSFNRENYTTPVSFNSFKESGAIEYGADIVLGLQLEAINHLQGNENEKKELLNQAKAMEPRTVELVGLKNRNGVPYFKCLFDYYPRFNYFKEINPNENKKL